MAVYFDRWDKCFYESCDPDTDCRDYAVIDGLLTSLKPTSMFVQKGALMHIETETKERFVSYGDLTFNVGSSKGEE